MSEDCRADFYGRNYIVTKDVLVPRAETEMVVDAVLNLAGKAYLPGVKAATPRLPEGFRILDVGTGSGCVAITIALELPETVVVASDIFSKALQVARENTFALGASKVQFVKSDLLAEVEGDFDVIVANLPYVDKDWEWVDTEALSVEPAVALYAEDGGLAVIKRLIRKAVGRTRFLVLEADPCQHERVIEFAKENGFGLVEERGYCLVFESAVR